MVSIDSNGNARYDGIFTPDRASIAALQDRFDIGMRSYKLHFISTRIITKHHVIAVYGGYKSGLDLVVTSEFFAGPDNDTDTVKVTITSKRSTSPAPTSR